MGDDARNADGTFADGNEGGPGAPPIYDDAFAEQARKLSDIGATDIEIADFFDVNVSTIYRWKAQHDRFCEAVTRGKAAADERVVRALYQRAVGYTFESEKVFHDKGEIVRAPTREHVPPDPGAAMNWLKNRQPDEWREKSEVEIAGKDGGPIRTSTEPASEEALIEQCQRLGIDPARLGLDSGDAGPVGDEGAEDEPGA